MGGLTSGSSARRALRAKLLREALVEAGVGAAGRLGFDAWAARVPEPRTGPLNFDLFPFQRELYGEGAGEREAVIMKSTQVGISAWAARWALYQSDVLGRTGLYVFPTQRDVHDFAAARIKPLSTLRIYLGRRQGRTDPANVGLVGLGGGMVYFRGSQARRSTPSTRTTWCSTSTTCSCTRTSPTPSDGSRDRYRPG